VFSTKIVNHGSLRGKTAQGLAQWRHPVASREAQDVLHWAMHPALYCLNHMVIKVDFKVGVFFASLILSLSKT
jgi:hypothetical protein